MHMTPRLSRRFFVSAAAAAAAAPLAAVHAAPANVPSTWDGKKMYDTFVKDGKGFSLPGPEGRPKAYVAFDPQCPDCDRLSQRLKPLQEYVDVVWFPIAYLNTHSEPQGASMLNSKEPWKLFEEQHERFKAPDFRGIRYDYTTLPESVRNDVWTNTKLHRRAGCRAVPYGVFKNSKGEYVPFDENLTTEELAKLFELKNYKPAQ
jgi:protein-disulfide isomerase